MEVDSFFALPKSEHAFYLTHSLRLWEKLQLTMQTLTEHPLPDFQASKDFEENPHEVRT